MFVSKIIQQADERDKKAIHEKTEVLCDKLQSMELEVHQLAYSKFVNFHPFLLCAEDLSQQVGDMTRDMNEITCKINTEIKEQTAASTGEFQALAQKLAESKIILQGLDYLSQVNDFFESSKAAVKSKNYSKASTSLVQLEEFLKQPLCGEEDKKLDILVAITTECAIMKGTLIQELSDSWTNSVTWRLDDSGSSIYINISAPEDGVSFELLETVQRLAAFNSLDFRMKQFAKMFKQHLIPFILENVDCQIETISNTSTKTIRVFKRVASDKKKNVNEEECYKIIFKNLLNILKELHSALLCIELGQDSIKEESSPETLMSILGREVSSWLLDIIQRDILAKAIPTSAKELEKFDSVIEETKHLQETLLSLGFLSPDNHVLLDYVGNVNLLFANKKSKEILQQARNLITSDLLKETVNIIDKPLGEWPPLSAKGNKKVKSIFSSELKLSDNTLRMPPCAISKNIQSLMELAYQSLSDARDCSPAVAEQTFYSVRGMFELFYFIVEIHHSQVFEAFPHGAALHNNNCMYISHHLMTLGHQFSELLPPTVTPTFVDMIRGIRESGHSVLVKQLDKQKSLLMDSLDLAEGFSNLEEYENSKKAEQAVKQTLLQLNHLSKVLKPVLPSNIYKKSMARLINAVVERLTESISSLEDIAQEAAQQLSALVNSVEEQAGETIVLAGEVKQVACPNMIPGWPRLELIKSVLGGSLHDIADLWADGKGPLAEAFSAPEVKQMIRALFQNTERRASLLSSIR